MQTTFNTWLTMKRTWFPKHQAITVPVPVDRGRGFTVYGAISTALANGYYIEFDESTNKWGFDNFLKNLALQLKEEYANTQPVIVRECPVNFVCQVLDNHTAHTSLDVQNTLSKYFQPEFIPPYSCQVGIRTL